MIHRNRGENRGTVCEVRVICVDVGQLDCHQVFYLQCKEDTELNFLRLFILLLNEILKVMETVWLYSYDEKKNQVTISFVEGSRRRRRLVTTSTILS